MSEKIKGSKCCEICKFYSALKEPRKRSDGATIYGYCFINGDKNYSPDMGKGYAVFVSNGFCKNFKQRKKRNADENA